MEGDDIWAGGWAPIPRAVLELEDATMTAVYCELVRRARRPRSPRVAKLAGYGNRLIEREVGQCVAGVRRLANTLRVGVQAVRTALTRLESTHCIRRERSHRGSLITVCGLADFWAGAAKMQHTTEGGEQHSGSTTAPTTAPTTAQTLRETETLETETHNARATASAGVREVIAAFNRALHADLEPDDWTVVVEAALEQYSPEQLRLVVAFASETYSPQCVEGLSPRSLFRLAAPAGQRTFPDRLKLAESRYRDDSGRLPWETTT